MAGSALWSLAASSDPSALPSCGDQTLDCRQRQCTYSNPLSYEEFEDPDITRVADDYYLADTTMHMNPAVQIMHSKDCPH